MEHVQCPICAKKGNDRNGDNLAIYSDGSSYCFSCGYFQTASGLSKLKTKESIPTKDIRSITLPADCDTILPARVKDWLSNYSLTEHDLKLHHVMWSEHWQRLIFPYIIDGKLVAWQGRSFSPTHKSKWFSQGDLKNILYVCGNHLNKTVVLVEDIISAIRVSNQQGVCAVPLFASHISTINMLRLAQFYDKLVVWLDKDKEKEAIKFTHDINLLGVNSQVIITDKDPKEYTNEEIHKWLYN